MGLLSTIQAMISNVSGEIVEKPPAPKTDRERQDAAVKKLLLCLDLYSNYRVDSRGPQGLLHDAIRELRPDVAKHLRDKADAADTYVSFFPGEDP
jgi:hypothetical protein